MLALGLTHRRSAALLREALHHGFEPVRVMVRVRVRVRTKAQRFVHRG